MLNQSALIIFIKNPVLGKVKTRLAKEIGKEAALSVYLDLLLHTRKITMNLPCSKFLFYSDYVDQDDEWDNKLYTKGRQLQTDDLGLRMESAFDAVFRKSFANAVIIGSDCFELTEKHILEAFTALDQHDIVIGPAQDGGYYLLGMKKLYSSLFRNKKWGTHTVLKDTLENINQLNITYKQLTELSDIDELEDLKQMENS